MRVSERLRAAYRAFVLGQGLDRSLLAFGVDPITYSPAEYGNYIATSNAVYVCANKRAKLLSSLPLALYKLKNDERESVTSGAAYELIRRVNPHWTFQRLINMTELSLCLWGVSYWFCERGSSGRQPPREIWWGRPDRVRVIPHESEYIGGFIYQAPNGQEIPFSPREVIWIRYPNPLDEYAGLSPLAAARLSADVASAAMHSNRNLFSNGMQLGGVVMPKSGTTLTAAQAEDIERTLAQRFKGVDKAHRWGVFRFDAEMKSVAFTPKDAEFLGALKWTLEDVARAYDVPLDLIGGQRSYENYNAAVKAMWTQCVLPEADFIASELNEQLAPMFGGEFDLAEFDASGVEALQEDRAEIVAQINTLAERGVPLNRLLQEFLPHLLPEGEGGYPWGDVWWASTALAPIRDANPPAAESEPTEEELPEDEAPVDEDAERGQRMTVPQRRAIEYGSDEHQRVWKRFVRQTGHYEGWLAAEIIPLFERQRDSVLARVQQLELPRGQRDGLPEGWEPFKLSTWIRTFRETVRVVLVRIVKDIADAALDLLGINKDLNMVDPHVIRFIEGRAQRFAEHVNETTWKMLKDSLAEGMENGETIPELSQRVQDVMGDRIRSTPETIARTEVIGATNGGTLLAWRESGIVSGKEWLSALDERVRTPDRGDEFDHFGAHGEVVPLDEPFMRTGEPLMFPGADGGSAANVINCRCTMNAVVIEEQK